MATGSRPTIHAETLSRLRKGLAQRLGVDANTRLKDSDPDGPVP